MINVHWNATRHVLVDVYTPIYLASLYQLTMDDLQDPSDSDRGDKVSLLLVEERRVAKSRACCDMYLWAGLLAGLLLSAAFLSLVVGLGLGLAGAGSPDPHSGTYQHAAVATDAPKCSEVGVAILEAGGSAVDAAISSLLCVGVINLQSTGVGGGGFMTVYNANDTSYTVIDYREVAPLLATKDMFNSTGPAGSRRGCSFIIIIHNRLTMECQLL